MPDPFFLASMGSGLRSPKCCDSMRSQIFTTISASTGRLASFGSYYAMRCVSRDYSHGPTRTLSPRWSSAVDLAILAMGGRTVDQLAPCDQPTAIGTILHAAQSIMVRKQLILS